MCVKSSIHNDVPLTVERIPSWHIVQQMASYFKTRVDVESQADLMADG